MPSERPYTDSIAGAGMRKYVYMVGPIGVQQCYPKHQYHQPSGGCGHLLRLRKRKRNKLLPFCGYNNCYGLFDTGNNRCNRNVCGITEYIDNICDGRRLDQQQCRNSIGSFGNRSSKWCGNRRGNNFLYCPIRLPGYQPDDSNQYARCVYCYRRWQLLFRRGRSAYRIKRFGCGSELPALPRRSSSRQRTFRYRICP